NDTHSPSSLSESGDFGGRYEPFVDEEESGEGFRRPQCVQNAFRGIRAFDHDIGLSLLDLSLHHLFRVYRPSFDNHGHDLVVDCSRVDIGHLKRAYPARHGTFLTHNREVASFARCLQSHREDALSLKSVSHVFDGNGCNGPKSGMRGGVPTTESRACALGSRPSPPENFGVYHPSRPREVIPQLAGLTELVLGDRSHVAFHQPSMTPKNIRTRPLSEPQERRLLAYLDEKYREIHQDYGKRHEPTSKLPTLRAYLDAMRSTACRPVRDAPDITFVTLTNTVMEDAPGYPPDSTDLVTLLKWLDLLDHGWLSVLCMQAWDPVRGEGVDLPQHLLEKTPPATQTDRTRVHSLLVTGTSTLEDWMEERRRTTRTASTLTRLRELEPDEGGDEEELLARLPSWDSGAGGLDGDADGLNEAEWVRKVVTTTWRKQCMIIADHSTPELLVKSRDGELLRVVVHHRGPSKPALEIFGTSALGRWIEVEVIIDTVSSKPTALPDASVAAVARTSELEQVFQREVSSWVNKVGLRQRLLRFGIPQRELPGLLAAFTRDVENGNALRFEEKTSAQLARLSHDVSSPSKRIAIDQALTSLLYTWATDPRHQKTVKSAVSKETLDRMVHLPVARTMRRKLVLHVGPTNSGKTHTALRTLAASRVGAYGGPLRLLAHEIYQRLNTGQIVPLGAEATEYSKWTRRAGTRMRLKHGNALFARPCSLLTGDERRVTEGATLCSCTVEMLSLERRYDVVVIDEIQMIADSQRGHAWTAAVLGVAADELHMCGEERAVPIIEALAEITGDELVINRYQRLSPLVVAPRSLDAT
ncbi:hypothetical protein BJY52DRAFT_1224580, partial [Lactarius psammicola]